MRKIIALLIFLTVSYGYSQCASGSTGAAPGETDFVLVWADEFSVDGPPCSDNWDYDIGGGGWGNGEAQYYTNSTNNANVQSGILTIKAIKENFGGNEYTSARLLSMDLYDFTYGRVEVRAKLPSSQGTWPAIWMLGANFDTVGWPHCGEIDIMEQTGSDKNKVLGTCHWFDGGNASYGLDTAVANATSEFHVYSTEWTTEYIRMFVDDVQYYELVLNSSLPFDAPFFMILNVAMGGTLGGTIDPEFTEASMEIDYVRVYQKEQALTEPLVSAPVPPLPQSEVISFFSDAYTNNAPSLFTETWGVGSVEDFVIGGTDNTKKYTDLGFQAITLSSLVDLNLYDHIHVDVWTPISNAFGLKLEDWGADGVDEFPNVDDSEMEVQSNSPQTAGVWVGHDFAISEYTALTGIEHFGRLQILLGSAVGGTIGTAFIDNLYLYKGTSLNANNYDISNFKVFPNPTQDIWIVKTGNQNIVSIQLFDILGKKVLSLTPNTTEVKINANSLKSGLYFARINTINDVNSVKLVKK